MFRFLLMMLVMTSMSGNAFALQLQTRRHAICGAESYYARTDAVCGVELYLNKVSSACPAIYNGRVDAQICGYHTVDDGLICKLCPNGDGENPHDWSCDCQPGSHVESNFCTNPAFGIAGYQSCRDPQHGVERYNSCRDPSFGIEQFKSCSFYKTPEEIDAYIEATYDQLSINSTLLPAKQADLYTSFRQEAAFICLIEKYKDLEGFDTVFDDLTQRFQVAFGYDYISSSVTCADAAANGNAPLTIRAGKLECVNYTVDTIKSLTKPDDMTALVFNRFKSTCVTKLTYDMLVSWFDHKLDETNQLLADIVAQTDAERKASLQELKKSITDSK